MSCNPNYPTVFPGECVASGILALKSADVPHAIDAGYVILGYGLGIVRSSVLVGAPAPLGEDERAQLAELRDLLEDGIGQTSDIPSQLLAFWHNVLAPQLKALLELLLANLS